MDDKERKWIKKRFEVTVKKSSFFSDEKEVILSVTHNKNQWSSIGLTDDEEVKAVIKALQDYLSRRGSTEG